jgi:hypothetical protein
VALPFVIALRAASEDALGVDWSGFGANLGHSRKWATAAKINGRPDIEAFCGER